MKKATNVEQVRKILSNEYRKTKTYYMGNSKSKDEKLAEIRKGKKEGDVGIEDGREMTKRGFAYMTLKHAGVLETLDKDRMPELCPHCGRTMITRLDKKPGNLEGKCFECVIEEEGKMRIKGTWKAYAENKLRANVLSEIKDRRQWLEQTLGDLSEKGNIVGNETGELEGWSMSKAQYNKSKGDLETQINQLNVIEVKLKKEQEEYRQGVANDS